MWITRSLTAEFSSCGLAPSPPKLPNPTLTLHIVIEDVCCFDSGSRSNKTFKPKKNIPEGTHQYDLMRHAAATLGSGNLRLAVMLPEGEDLNEWVAVNS